MKDIVFAFAVNKKGEFMEKHFGDAEEYHFYKTDNGKLVFIEKVINAFKSIDENVEHGLKPKGEAIIKFLESKNVNVLVSMQFGKNIRMINKFFIPIVISIQETEQAVVIIEKQLHWIEDELINAPKEYKLFTIADGILKTTIK
ncbi:MAG: hypothetical protein GXO79_15635 [Chlorobi bacterium]|nr:hypothetical protein [Chlorobiota bacterium]